MGRHPDAARLRRGGRYPPTLHPEIRDPPLTGARPEPLPQPQLQDGQRGHALLQRGILRDVSWPRPVSYTCLAVLNTEGWPDDLAGAAYGCTGGGASRTDGRPRRPSQDLGARCAVLRRRQRMVTGPG